MVAETERCNDISREFLKKTHHYLSVGDLPQASEKRWGAAAVKVKSVHNQRVLNTRGTDSRGTWLTVSHMIPATMSCALSSA